NAESRSSYEKGLANWQKLVKPDVAKPENRTAVRGTGVALQRLGWSAEAAVAYRQALALLEGGKEPGWCAVARCRSLLAAVASEPGSGVTADEGRTRADEAVNALHKSVAGRYANVSEAVAAGYVDVDRLAKEIDPDFLRQRTDFQRLLAEI